MHDNVCFQLQISQIVAENQRLSEELRSCNELHRRAVRSLEQKVDGATKELRLVEAGHASVQAEYDSYKVGGLTPCLNDTIIVALQKD